MSSPDTNPALPEYQLCRLDGDVTERHNLYGLEPEIEREMLEETAQIIRRGRSTPGTPQPNTDNPIWPGLEFME